MVTMSGGVKVGGRVTRVGPTIRRSGGIISSPQSMYKQNLERQIRYYAYHYKGIRSTRQWRRYKRSEEYKIIQYQIATQIRATERTAKIKVAELRAAKLKAAKLKAAELRIAELKAAKLRGIERSKYGIKGQILATREKRVAELIRKRDIEGRTIQGFVMPEKPLYKKVYHGALDIFGGATYGVWFDQFGRPTAHTPAEIKEQAKETVKPSIKDIISYPYYTTKIAVKSVISAFEFRKSGEVVLAKQQFQLSQIEKEIEKIGEKGKRVEEIPTKKLEEDIKKYEQDVEKFNIAYEGKELIQEDYEKALEEQKTLTTQQTRLEARKSHIQKQYDVYETQLKESGQKLREKGVTMDIGEKDITFKSDILEKKIAPLGVKLHASFLDPSGKASWKNILYGTTQVAHTTATAYVVGMGVGSTGILAKIGTRVATLPKATKILVSVGAGSLVTAGVGMKTYTAYQLGKIMGVGKISAVVGGLSATGQVVGFVAGGYHGTKLYYQRVEQQILAGKYTKSIAEAKEGAFLKYKGKVKGGITKQLGKYETTIKGTKYKIDTGIKIKGQYGSQSGMSKVKVYTKFLGKRPRGYPKEIISKGQMLETDKWLKLKFFTKAAKGKVWYKQEILMKRSLLEKLKVDVSTKPMFKGYTEAERLKFLTQVKLVGEPMKVAKLPKTFFKEGEMFRFFQWKGKGKIMQPWEWSEAKIHSIFGTKQYILYEPEKLAKFGKLPQLFTTDWKVQEFQSLSKTKGATTELLQAILKGKLAPLKTKLIMDKSGRMFLTPQKLVTEPITKIKPIQPSVAAVVKTEVPVKSLISLQLKQIVPSLIAEQSLLVTPAVISISTATIGLKHLLGSRAHLLQTPSIKNIARLKIETAPKVTELTAQLQRSMLRMAGITKPITQPIAQPVIKPPILPPIPPIFPAPPPILSGYIRRARERRGKRRKKGLVYVEGFTAKSIGLPKIQISIKQARKLLKKSLTGLEIRRGVYLK